MKQPVSEMGLPTRCPASFHISTCRRTAAYQSDSFGQAPEHLDSPCESDAPGMVFDATTTMSRPAALGRARCWRWIRFPVQCPCQQAQASGQSSTKRRVQRNGARSTARSASARHTRQGNHSQGNHSQGLLSRFSVQRQTWESLAPEMRRRRPASYASAKMVSLCPSHAATRRSTCAWVCTQVTYGE